MLKTRVDFVSFCNAGEADAMTGVIHGGWAWPGLWPVWDVSLAVDQRMRRASGQNRPERSGKRVIGEMGVCLRTRDCKGHRHRRWRLHQGQLAASVAG